MFAYASIAIRIELDRVIEALNGFLRSAKRAQHVAEVVEVGKRSAESARRAE